MSGRGRLSGGYASLQLGRFVAGRETFLVVTAHATRTRRETSYVWMNRRTSKAEIEARTAAAGAV